MSHGGAQLSQGLARLPPGWDRCCTGAGQSDHSAACRRPGARTRARAAPPGHSLGEWNLRSSAVTPAPPPTCLASRFLIVCAHPRPSGRPDMEKLPREVRERERQVTGQPACVRSSMFKGKRV